MFAASKTGAPVSAANYIEDVFSTYLYTGTGANLTITNDIDLSGKGGLVWIKQRSAGGESHRLFDTVRGATKSIRTNATSAEVTTSDTLTAFNSNGFNLGAGSGSIGTNTSASTYVSWAFREQAKFFDVVTYTGTGSNTTISHNLGSVPGTIIIKRTDTTSAWAVYHRSLANTEYMVLNTTAAKATGATYWNSTTPTSTVFSLGTATDVNANAGTYVAYLFAHDAGGFGLTGNDNVISCGLVTGAGQVNLGYEPQWMMMKSSASVGNWMMIDNMRGTPVSGSNAELEANLAQAETTNGNVIPNATGFYSNFSTGVSYIYIAIRRGPMKVPTSGTSVFSPVARTGTGAAATVTSGFVTDLVIPRSRASSTRGSLWFDRMRGKFLLLSSANTDAELSDSQTVTGFDTQNGVLLGTDNSPIGVNVSGVSYINYLLRRAPSFFDVVCYTETGVAVAQPHNLGVVPELIIQKTRSSATNWVVSFNFTSTTQNLAKLNLTTAANINITYASAGQMTAAPTATNVNLAAAYATNTTLVMYLFATLAGISKVGIYTGTGALQTINCGFASGARFVLVKRLDSTGDWYVWDSARGISSGNDPYLLLNSTAAEVTGTNYVDTDTTGFKVTAAAPAAINANGGSFVFLAIA